MSGLPENCPDPLEDLISAMDAARAIQTEIATDMTHVATANQGASTSTWGLIQKIDKFGEAKEKVGRIGAEIDASISAARLEAEREENSKAETQQPKGGVIYIIDDKYVQHLGDGAYISEDGCGGYVLTANHDDPEQATGVVVLGPFEMDRLLQFVQIVNKRHQTPQHD